MYVCSQNRVLTQKRKISKNRNLTNYSYLEHALKVATLKKYTFECKSKSEIMTLVSCSC